MRFTDYFAEVRSRPDRAIIQDDWIEAAIRSPIHQQIQHDGRIRRWIRVPGIEERYLRVVLLEDGVTVHNAFFDRRFKP
ncbi:MAG: hypothetical protein ACRER4_09020 [Steroidobacteraceae bacterium]